MAKRATKPRKKATRKVRALARKLRARTFAHGLQRRSDAAIHQNILGESGVRMIITNMEERECHDLLARVRFGRLACSHENQPYIIPTYFAADREYIYAFATSGQKIEWMHANPLVCMEADEVKSHNNWASVIVTGSYKELSDTPAHASLRQRAHHLLEKRVRWWQTAFAGAQTRKTDDRDIPVVYCIRIVRMTGHRASPDPVEFKHDFGAD